MPQCYHALVTLSSFEDRHIAVSRVAELSTVCEKAENAEGDVGLVVVDVLDGYFEIAYDFV